jgi:hypothetical protein
MNPNQKKASDEDLVAAYGETKSVWAAAKRFGMCGQTVHQRLTKLGACNKMNVFTKADDERLEHDYDKYRACGKLQELADQMGRTKPFICRQAKRLGMTDNGRMKKPWATKHGLGQHPLYPTWSTMVARCYNPNHIGYKNYGERGISVCDESRESPASFIEWSYANGYESGLTIDRINNNGNYEPSNCRYVDRQTQARNTRSNVMSVVNGDLITIAEAAEQANLRQSTVWRRYRRGHRGAVLVCDTHLKTGEPLLPNDSELRRLKYSERVKIKQGDLFP